MATILDEAFAFLLVENYWDEWSKKNLEEYVCLMKQEDNMGEIYKRSIGSTPIFWVESRWN